MTSKALSNNGFKKQLLWNLKSQKWLLIAFVAIRMIISALMSILICSSSGAVKDGTALNSVAVKLLNDVTYSITSPLTVIDVVIGTICSFVVLNTLFAFLYSKRKTDLYHGFPITRGAYYWAAICFILIINAISLVGEFFIITLISKLYSAVSFADLGIIFLTEILIFAMLASITGILAISISVSGMVVSYIVNSVLMLVVLPLSLYSLFIIFEIIVPAFANSFANIWAIFPYGLLFARLINDDVSLTLSICISLAVAVLAFIVGLYFYRKRKSESSEGHPSSNVPFYLGVMGLSVLAGVIACYVSHNVWIAVAVAAAIALVIMFVMNLIGEKRIKKSTVLYWLGFCAVFTGVMVTAEYGMASYSNRIPEVSQVKSVVIDLHQYGYGNVNFVERLFEGNYMLAPNVKLQEEESIKAVNAFHKEALSRSEEKHVNVQYVKLIYTLKDGETVSRVLPYNFVDPVPIGTEPTEENGELKTFEALKNCDEYVRKEAMPYEAEDLASIYISVNNKSIVLKGEDAEKVFKSYTDNVEKNSVNNSDGPIYYPSNVEFSDQAMSGENGKGYDMEMKFVFFTDKTTDAAKKVFYNLPVKVYEGLYQSNESILIHNITVNTSKFADIEKLLTEKGFFTTASSLDYVTDNWKLVITPIDYSIAESPFGRLEYVSPSFSPTTWELSKFNAILKDNTSGDLLIKTHYESSYNFDFNHLLKNAESFDPEQAVNDLRANGKGYVYYFTNESSEEFSESTKLYFTSELK